jgi:hypothetical protein
MAGAAGGYRTRAAGGLQLYSSTREFLLQYTISAKEKIKDQETCIILRFHTSYTGPHYLFAVVQPVA